MYRESYQAADFLANRRYAIKSRRLLIAIILFLLVGFNRKRIPSIRWKGVARAFASHILGSSIRLSGMINLKMHA